MLSISVLSPVAVAAVFTVAGLAKLADPERDREHFGLPPRLAGRVLPAVPYLELALAGALLLPGATRYAAAAAVTLLAIFTGVLAARLRARRPTRCRCFGRLSSGPVRWTTLVRNLVLILVAIPAVLVGEAPPPLVHLGWLVLIAGGWSAGRGAWLAGRGGRPGRRAPDFVLPDLRAGTVRLRDLCAAGPPVLLVFVSAGCGGCRALLPDLERWQRDLAGRLTVVPVASGGVARNRTLAGRYAFGLYLLDDGGRTADRYGCPELPSAVLVTASVRIAAPAARGSQRVRELVAELRLRSAGTRPAVSRRRSTPCPLRADELSSVRPDGGVE